MTSLYSALTICACAASDTLFHSDVSTATTKSKRGDVQGFPQDGDDSVEFQPQCEDDEEDSEIADLLEKAREQDQSLTNRLASLSQEIRTERTEMEALKKELEEIDQEMKEAFNTDSLKSLQSQAEKLSEKWQVIKEKRRPLGSGHNVPGDFGMVAVYVEQAICAYVLPEVFLNDDKASLRRLLTYLNGKNRPFPLNPKEYDCEGILSNGRSRWEILCKNFNFSDAWKTRADDEWTIHDCSVPGDIRAIEVLKMGGVCIDFPCPICLKYAEEKVELMKDELSPWQFKLVAEFIGSLRDKITKTGLHHDNLYLD